MPDKRFRRLKLACPLLGAGVLLGLAVIGGCAAHTGQKTVLAQLTRNPLRIGKISLEHEAEVNYEFRARVSGRFDVVFVPESPHDLATGTAAIAVDLLRSDGSCLVRTIVELGNEDVSPTAEPMDEQIKNIPLHQIPSGRTVEITRFRYTPTGLVVRPHSEVTIFGPCRNTPVFHALRRREYTLWVTVLSATGIRLGTKAAIEIRPSRTAERTRKE